MSTRSLTKVRSLSGLGLGFLALAACSAPPTSGVDDAVAAGARVTPANIQPCPSCTTTPLTFWPASFAFGTVGAFDDPMGGVRSAVLQVTAARTGTMFADFLNSFDGRWRVTSFGLPGGVTVAGAGPVAVTAGEAVTINFEYVSDFTLADGSMNTDLIVDNAGTSSWVPLTLTSTILNPAAAILVTNVSLTCETYGGPLNEIQLGDAPSGCKDAPYNAFELKVSILNLGGVAGSFSVEGPIRESGLLLTCTTGSGTVAPGQLLTFTCKGTAEYEPEIGLPPGTNGFIPIAQAPFSLWVLTPSPASGTPYTFATQVVGTPVPTTTPAGGSGGSGSSGSTPTCSQADPLDCTGTGCTTCKENCGDGAGCSELGTFCTLSAEQTAIVTYAAGCSVCCDDACMATTCPAQ